MKRPALLHAVALAPSLGFGLADRTQALQLRQSGAIAVHIHRLSCDQGQGTPVGASALAPCESVP